MTLRPWRAMTDDELVARCRQRPAEIAWDNFGQRYGAHLGAAVVVAWFLYASRPIPGFWIGLFAVIVIYLWAAFFSYVLLFLFPSGARIIPYVYELDRRHSLLSFPREAREARRLFERPDPPDWVLLVHSEGGEFGWRWTRLTLAESPPSGLREHRSGPVFGVLRDPKWNPLTALLREERTLGEEECLAKLAALREMDWKRVESVELRATVPYLWMAVLRRDPPLTRKVKFSPIGVIFDPESRHHPTYRLASLVIDLPKDQDAVRIPLD